MTYTIVDRRSTSGGKSLSNRKRFIEKVKGHIKNDIKKGIIGRSITSQDGVVVHIPEDGIAEPWIHNDSSIGNHDYVLPGNKDFIPGDSIKKKKEGTGSGKPTEASDQEGGEDAFEFVLSKEEYFEMLFDDLELPELLKRSKEDVVVHTRERAGFTNSGTPATLDLERSLINGIGRRIALKNPKLKKIKELEEQLVNETDKDVIVALEDEISRLKNSANAVHYLDPMDLKYKNFENRPKPISQAVMFCVMDVSGSMGEHEKELAKRFYILLYLFLTYKYKKVDIVFIRHHVTAMECSEHDFFYLKESGGTIVSAGIIEMERIMKERYDPTWNIYLAQTSDGDNFETDSEKFTKHIKDLLSQVQQYIYLEVKTVHSSESPTSVWRSLEDLNNEFENIHMKKVFQKENVYAVFKELFKKKEHKK